MKKSAKLPAILLAISILATAILFRLTRNKPQLIWAGAATLFLALVFFLWTLTRFLRNRSITSGLFIATTSLTVLYFLGTRFVNTALPLMFSSVNASTAESMESNPGFFTPLVCAQIGLFILWFLLILFVIYVYVRPIKKIDFLLEQILEAKEIKKLSLGHGKQYRAIADKLALIAAEKYAQEQKRQARQAMAQARKNSNKTLVNKLLKEQAKIPGAKRDAESRQ